MSNISKGIVLGLANTLVLAAGYSSAAPVAFYDRNVPPVLPLFLLGAIPAIPLGAILGVVAGRARGERLPTLLVSSFGLVACLVVLCSPLMQPYRDWQVAGLIALAWVPTSFATIVLERWTRPAELPSAWVLARPGSCSGSREPRARTASCT
ncbi:MAG: hypothetical protein ACM31C_14240 [Acidobacteriota bacterium]